MSMRPREGSARSSKAAGEKSKSVSAQPVQRSVMVTCVLFPWKKAVTPRLQTGLLLGFVPVYPGKVSNSKWETAAILSLPLFVIPQAPRPIPYQVP